jgi:hypothetical protein
MEGSQKTRRFGLISAILLTAILSACGRFGSSGAPSQSDPLGEVDSDLRTAIELREDLGLRSDEAWVRQVAANPDADSDLIGIPLTPAESRELEERFARSEDAAAMAGAYGREHPDTFAGLYVDQEHAGRIVVRFTADHERHQAALDALWGEPGVIVVEAAHFTEAALQDIQHAIADARKDLERQGIVLIEVGSGGFENVVEVVVKSDNPGAEDVIKAFGPAGAVAVEVFPADKPWSNPAGGPGWRFLGSFRTDHPYEVGVALTRAQFTQQLERFGIDAPSPSWDPSTEIVAFFSDGLGSSCPEVRIDAVTFDVDDALVYPTMSDPLAPRACTADLAGGQTFVIALARDSLPGRQFTLILKPDLPHLGKLNVTLE